MPGVNVTVTTHGLEKLDRLAAVLRATGNKDLVRALDKALRSKATPLTKSARQGARQGLPYRGGLADLIVATTRFSARVDTRGDRVSLRITATGKHDLSRMDDGRLRHPVYGHRKVWVTQAIRPGWFTNPLLLDAPSVRDDIDNSLDDLGQRMEASV